MGKKSETVPNTELTRGMHLHTPQGFKEISYVDWTGENVTVVFMDGNTSSVTLEGSSKVIAS